MGAINRDGLRIGALTGKCFCGICDWCRKEAKRLAGELTQIESSLAAQRRRIDDGVDEIGLYIARLADDARQYAHQHMITKLKMDRYDDQY
jgi:hypothetical protein